MLSLVDIQDSYGFKRASWKVEGDLIETEKGLKRIIIWSDEKKLRWHLMWRDELSKRTECLCNRMIQTKVGERVLLTNAGWVTIHDEVTTLFSYKGREKDFGEFLGKYYSSKISGIDVELSDETFNKHARQWSNLNSRYHFPKENRFLLKKLQREAAKRLDVAHTIIEKQDMPVPPIVSPIRSLNQGKNVFEKLYWENRSLPPEKGYRSLRLVLLQWLQRYGPDSVRTLLKYVDQHFPLKKVHGTALLVECLSPREFILFLQQIESGSPESFKVAYEELKRQWDTTCELVKLVSEWADLSREKVSV
ncbi:hypothetical protein LGQ02_14880 [Bacillus shivajii]|uniref:hypothetical protein n=1 Tax=Bacillus shivajii TaxID=1983719 RepID=UPI001CFC2E70|nr:hypothetical protein [Bacillus shivajii]UCZ52122.1 hypothetical protein LGQ02_14880 [Bacillus shivajii]